MLEPSPYSRPIVFTEIEQFGGAERAALALYRWLSERGLDCHIVAYRDDCDLAGYAPFPIEVVQLTPSRGAWSKVSAMRKYFAERLALAPLPLLSGYQPAMHATLAGVRGFHTLMHDTASLFDDPSQDGLKRRARRRLSNEIVGFGLRSGGNTIVTSEFLRDECWRDFRVRAEIARMGGLANTADAATVRNSPRSNGSMRLLSVSRVETNKRIDWLLEALAELDRTTVSPLQAPFSRLVDWRFDVVGRGPMIESLHKLAEQLGISQRVQFRGFVPDAELDEIYACADLFLMPAVQGYGIPAIESLSRGIPVFLHRESGVSDVLLDTPWATVMMGGKAETAASLAAAIDGVLRGRHLSSALPELPTEDAWAERVAGLCGWL